LIKKETKKGTITRLKVEVYYENIFVVFGYLNVFVIFG